MWWLVGQLVGLGPSFIDIANRFIELKKAREEAKNNERLAAINAEIEALHDRRAVLVAEAGSRINAIIRAVAAAGPILLLLKIFVWDKVVGSFRGCSGTAGEFLDYCLTHRTDALDPYLWGVVAAVIGFYFLTTRK